MTNDEIIKMAKQAGARRSSNPDEYDVMKITYCGLESFAKMVAEKELEACAKTESTHRGAQVLIDLDEIEKFAELIVRDCLDIAFEVRGKPATDTHYVIGYDRACEKMISGIREHFGVEE